MSMLVSDKGTAYSDNFFTVKGSRIINNFTGRSMGILVRTIPSTNYLCAKKRTMIQRMIRWFWKIDEEYQRKHNIPSEAHGSLVDTMNGLRKEDR